MDINMYEIFKGYASVEVRKEDSLISQKKKYSILKKMISFYLILIK